jgi:hypothetical protein
MMDMTTSPATNALQPLQQDVQRLLGRCLLRLQQYERLMKAIVAHHEISGPAHSLEAIRTARIGRCRTKTLHVGRTTVCSGVITDGMVARNTTTISRRRNFLSHART